MLDFAHADVCPVCKTPGQTCGPPIGAAIVGRAVDNVLTSSSLPQERPRGGTGMSNIVVQQEVYEKLGDGRVVVAAAANEEISPRRAEQLGIAEDGSAGPDALTDALAAQDAAPTSPGGMTTPTDVTVMLDQNVREVTKSLATVTSPDDLDRLEAAENDRNKPRAGVLDAIEARREELDAS